MRAPWKAKQRRDVLILAMLVVAATVIGLVILKKQRAAIPSWIPFIGQKFSDVDAELSTAQALSPGQGQSVTIAGVRVGEISKVRLEKGRAIATLHIEQKYRHRINSDASVLLRPKTGLKDMVAQLDPGNRSAGMLKDGKRILVSRTLPDVNVDEILAALDTDTRSYLQLLLQGASDGLRGNGRDLSNTLRRVDPTARYMSEIGDKLAKRRKSLRRVIHNLSLLTQELGGKDEQLAALVKNSNAVFEILAAQDAHLRSVIQELPSTLKQTDEALVKAGQLSTKLGETLNTLKPSAKEFAKTQRDLQPFLRDTQRPIDKQIRPLVKESRPVGRDLGPAVKDLKKATPDLTEFGTVLNRALNMLAYKPPGQEGFLFWLAWTNHLAASVMSFQDAHGPVRRGVFLGSCTAIGILNTVAAANPQLGTLVGLLNAPSPAEACSQPKTTVSDKSRSVNTSGVKQNLNTTSSSRGDNSPGRKVTARQSK